MEKVHNGGLGDARGRSKSDTPRVESYTIPHYMTHMQDLEHNLSVLEVPSDLNIHGGEYRPRSSTSTSASRGRPPASHQKNAQATRHARRLYFGGFSPATEEDRLKEFLSDVIASGLREVNDNSYILSVYLNQKKCFAFVELKSIELTSACLSLDGVVMDGFPLKVQRANEYKPDLVPPVKAVIQLDLSNIQFQDGHSSVVKGLNGSAVETPVLDRLMIPQVALSALKHGDVALVGISYIGGGRGEDSTDALSSRRVIKSYLHSASSSNPEYGVDISEINVVDVGDVNLTSEDLEEDGGSAAVHSMMASIVAAGAIPVLLGSGHKIKAGDAAVSAKENCCYATVTGVMAGLHEAASGGAASGSMADVTAGISVAVMTVSARIHRVHQQLLSDCNFCENGSGRETCDGRLRAFGLQGSHCTMDACRHLLSRGALLTWLSRDIRAVERQRGNSSYLLQPFEKKNSLSAAEASTFTGGIFLESMQKLCLRKETHVNSGVLSNAESDQHPRAIVLCMHPDGSAFGGGGGTCPLGSRCSVCSDPKSLGGEGFTPTEWLDMAVIAGQQKNIVALNLSGWNGVIGCHRLPATILGSIFYHYLIGMAISRAHPGDSVPINYFSSEKLNRNDSNSSTLTASTSRSIFEAFKYSDSRKTLLDDAEFRLEDIEPRRTSVSDATVPYGMLERKSLPISTSRHGEVAESTSKGESASLSNTYPSLGIAIPPDSSSEGPRTTPGHGLFADTPGSFIARGALSILESPLGSGSTDRKEFEKE